MGIRKIVPVFLLWLIFTHLTAQPAVTTNYRRADSVAALFSGHSLDTLKELSQNLTHEFSNDFDRFRAIYTWVCTNIRNDYDLFTLNQRKQLKWADRPEKLHAWRTKFSSRVFRTLLRDKATLCTGYACLVQQLALHAGIECRIINGYGRGPRSNIEPPGMVNHSWNAVRLGGKWYLCDPTWSSGSIESRFGKFLPRYDDVYFLADPGLFVQDHYPEDPSWTLLENPPLLDDFLSGPVVYKPAYRYAFQPKFPKQLEVRVNRGTALEFQFSTPEPRDAVALRIVRRAQARDWKVTVTEKDGLYSLCHTFKDKGVHDVHITVHKEIVASYRIIVLEP